MDTAEQGWYAPMESPEFAQFYGPAIKPPEPGCQQAVAGVAAVHWRSYFRGLLV